MVGDRETSAFRNTNLQLITLIVITALSFFANIAGLSLGLSVITPLLFYLPVILAAYWFPRKGVIFSVGVGVLEVFLMYLYTYPNIPDITYAVTTASFYVLVAIAIIISSLSGNLRDREARYHGIFDHSETGIFLVKNGDQNLNIVEANSRGAFLLGSNPKDLVGRPFSLYWTESEKRKILFQALSKGGSSPTIETTVQAATGETIAVLMMASRLPEGMVVLTLTDISAQKAQEEEIRARNRQLSTMNAVIREASGASSVESIGNHTLRHIMELVECESGGISFPGVAGRRPAQEFFQGDDQLLAELNGSMDEEVREWRLAFAQNRSFFFSRDSTPGEAGAGALAGIVLPIPGKVDPIGALYLATRKPWKCPSAEKEILDSLVREIGTAVRRVRLAEELTEANHQANLYLDILMHDINNANLASLWYGDLLLEMLEGEPKVMAGKMIEGIQKSREIIRNLETIRKIQEREEELKMMDLDGVIRKEVHHFPDTTISYNGCSVKVYGDDLIGEIFTNLIGNSVRYGGPGVQVEIDVSPVRIGEVSVSIADTGPGIPDELKRVIFQRFSQIESHGTGKGLGLYIVNSLLDRYGGTIRVEDRVPGSYDQGARFTFSLKTER